MKKTFKTMLALMAGAMTFTGCTSDILENTPEQIPSALKPMTFTAIQEGQGDATRTAIDGTAINWTKGDKISIFDGVADEKYNFAHEFTLTGEGGSTSGTFIGTAKEGAETYYALYPSVESVYNETEDTRKVKDEDLEKLGIYPDDLWRQKEKYEYALEYEPENAENELESILRELPERVMGYNRLSDEGKAIVVAYITGEMAKFKNTTKSGVQRDGDNFTNVVLPAAQTATAGSADPNTMLMIGKSTDASTIEFKNVCAFVKVTPEFNCTEIALCSNGSESLAGTMTVNYNSGAPTTTVTNGTNMVTLSALSGTTIEKGKTYYIAVRPETLNSGFTIIFNTTDGKYKKSTSKQFAFTRSEVLNLGSFNTSSNLTVDNTIGKATRTDDVEVNWVQLWAGGPKFAEYNVGASSITEYGGHYTWGGFEDVDGIENPLWNRGAVSLPLNEDTAYVLWGSNWRMPTKDDIDMLLENCNVTSTTVGDVKGYKFSGKGAYAYNSIFLPNAGTATYGPVSGQGDYAYYWSSTPSEWTSGSGSRYCYCIVMRNNVYVDSWDSPHGYSVRAVLNESAE